MEFSRAESNKTVCYTMDCQSTEISKEGLSVLATRAQELFKQLKNEGKVSQESINFFVTSEGFTGRDKVFSFKISSSKIESCSTRELFKACVSSYASANLDNNELCFVISKS